MLGMNGRKSNVSGCFLFSCSFNITLSGGGGGGGGSLCLFFCFCFFDRWKHVLEMLEERVTFLAAFVFSFSLFLILGGCVSLGLLLLLGFLLDRWKNMLQMNGRKSNPFWGVVFIFGGPGYSWWGGGGLWLSFCFCFVL